MSTAHDHFFTTTKTASRRLEEAHLVFRTLNSPLRLRLILLLGEREHIVGELTDCLHESQPLISQHLHVLKQAKMVDSRRQGRQMVYWLTDDRILEIITLAAETFEESSID